MNVPCRAPPPSEKSLYRRAHISPPYTSPSPLPLVPEWARNGEQGIREGKELGQEDTRKMKVNQASNTPRTHGLQRENNERKRRKLLVTAGEKNDPRWHVMSKSTKFKTIFFCRTRITQ